MKKIILTMALACATGIAFAAPSKHSGNHLTPAQAAAKYTEVINLRSQKIVDALHLSNADTAAKVHAIIMNQYRKLNSWHNTNDPKIKAAHRNKAVIAKINAPLRRLHVEYLAKLSRYLTPAQIDIVKDKMTYGKVEFTFKGYCVEYPHLTAANKQMILRYLKEAREVAMDAGSSHEKSAIFNRYKGKINNYLSKQGKHSKKWIKEHAGSHKQ